ncbi:hypothetical protein [Scytonema hofmannii]|uniref:hypothetical protein n=1 Tax=Scytonema hofmannii TaxID=34078 RepID=UPI000345B6C6|nr:hypothetical protein [Scytonema hofmannii]
MRDNGKGIFILRRKRSRSASRTRLIADEELACKFDQTKFLEVIALAFGLKRCGCFLGES